MTNQANSYKFHSKYSGSKTKTDFRARKYSQGRNILANFLSSDGESKGKAKMRKEFSGSMATLKSKLGESKFLNNPSIFTENHLTSSNLSQKPLKKVKERSCSNKNRHDEFYQSQIKFIDEKQIKIK